MGQAFANLYAPQAPERPNILQSIGESTQESIRAAGMMLHLYHPETLEEGAKLQKRFIADAAMLGVSALTGGVTGAAMKGVEVIGPVAKAIIGGALTGASGNAAFAGVEGQPVLPAAIAGAGMGAAFGVPAGLMARGAEEAVAKLAAHAAPEPPVAVPKGPQVGVFDLGTYGIEHPNAIPPQPAETIAEAATRPFDTGYVNQVLEQSAALDAPDIRAGRVAEAVHQMWHPTQEQVDASPLLQVVYKTRKGSTTVPLSDPRTAVAAASGITPPITGTVMPVFSATRTYNPWLGEVPTGPATPKQMQAMVSVIRVGREIEKVSLAEARTIFKAHVDEGMSFSTRLPRRPRVNTVRATTNAGMQIEEAAAPEVQNIASTNSIVDRMLQKLPDGDRARDVFTQIGDFYKRAILVSSYAVSKMGPVGAAVASRMVGVIDSAAQLASKDLFILKKLTEGLAEADLRHLGLVLHGAEAARTPELGQIAEHIRTLLDNVAGHAQAVKLQELVPSANQVRPFAYRKNFFPMVYPDKVIRALNKEGPAREAALRSIMADPNLVSSRTEAQALLTRYLKMPPEIRYGHLQVARELSLPDFEQNIMRVLPQYFMRAWKRIETARVFGAGDEEMTKVGGFLSQLTDGGYDANLARETYLAFADRVPHQYGAVVKLTRSANVITMLSTAGFVQLGQHSNTIAYIGMKNYLRGLGALFTQEGKDWAAQAGSYLQELIGEVTPIGEQSASARWMQFILLTPLDKANRIIATLGGYFHAQEVAEKYVAAAGTAGAAKLERQLVQMGLEAGAVLKQGGKLTNDQLRTAAQQVSHITQFRGSALDRPLYSRTAIGQFTYLFKHFAIAQFRFTGLLMNEARQGNFAPLLRYLAAAGTLTAGVGHVATVLRGNKQPDHPGWAYLDAAASGGALGISYDALKAMASGPEFVANFLGGPTAGDIYQLFGRDVPEAARGNPRVIMTHALSKTPIIGRRVARWLTSQQE